MPPTKSGERASIVPQCKRRTAALHAIVESGYCPLPEEVLVCDESGRDWQREQRAQFTRRSIDRLELSLPRKAGRGDEDRRDLAIASSASGDLHLDLDALNFVEDLCALRYEPNVDRVLRWERKWLEVDGTWLLSQKASRLSPLLGGEWRCRPNFGTATQERDVGQKEPPHHGEFP
jgi:hypothetical protein